MPLWDSVQRGLEKASQEAARIAKMQRLRSTIDNLLRQMTTQQNNLINKSMELYSSGQLIQGELISICQELANLKQQLDDAQNELKQVQASQPAPQADQTGGSGMYPQTLPDGSLPYSTGKVESNYELAPTMYAPPPPGYEPYASSDLTPPPPPGTQPQTISSIDTVMMGGASLTAQPTVVDGKRVCAVCQAEVQPEHAFCHNCGSLMQDGGSQHLPTVRSGILESTYSTGEETIRADPTSTPEAAQQQVEKDQGA